MSLAFCTIAQGEVSILHRRQDKLKFSSAKAKTAYFWGAVIHFQSAGKAQDIEAAMALKVGCSFRCKASLYCAGE
ncbi:hypothetical protein JF50_01375 [Pseudoalteromonas luteoviolacea]|uniref:Uncharacterized protein n=1 Tax=Pseudoalteromonas luteoviolacea TaxID=43657 RepID=A0A0C1MF88_9GAMM|nr:hypothetical protein JF50_19760 [Pseudoalteromonas luteoviolacea]KID58568.1 hypothetical protein JF50_01375 [Pseudoalteromonas luteoviolacea]